MRHGGPGAIGAIVVVLVSGALWVFGVLETSHAARLGATLVLVVLVSALLRRCARTRLHRSGLDAALRRDQSASSVRPMSLERLERLTAMSFTTGDVHFRLRPVLVEIATHRLRAFRGIDLERDDVATEALLGPRLYEIVRAGRPHPADRWARADVTADDVAEFVSVLESL